MCVSRPERKVTSDVSTAQAVGARQDLGTKNLLVMRNLRDGLRLCPTPGPCVRTLLMPSDPPRTGRSQEDPPTRHQGRFLDGRRQLEGVRPPLPPLPARAVCKQGSARREAGPAPR
jgi:hypothetical protein